MLLRNFLALPGVFALITASACGPLEDPDLDKPLGLAVADRSVPGPTVRFEPLATPQAEIPFPNDLALRRRADGATFVNVSTIAGTKLDSRNREHLGQIEGFSGLTPIQIAFDGPIDLTTVTDQTVQVINIEHGSPRFGERLPLDLGRGWFPHDAQPHAYFPLDPYASFDSFILPPNNKVDSDGDGKPDKWVYYYETLTHTLDIRPLMPLQSGAQYAVVLTRGIKGWDKDGHYGPIRSPLPAVNHDTQTADLQRALPALAKVGIASTDIGFAWTLTTGDLARTFRALRDGLYGKGQFAWLDKEFAPKINDVYDMEISFDGDGTYGPLEGAPFPVVGWDHTFALQGAYMQKLFGLINQFVPAGGFEHVSHVVFGDFETVNLRATPDNVWRLDVKKGTVDVDESKFHEKVPFLLVVPKSTAAHKPPFPVVVYAHATGTSRIECLLMADKLAQAGIATFSIDAVGHGPVLADPLKYLADSLGGDGGGYAGLLKALLVPMLFPDHETHFAKKDAAGQPIKDAGGDIVQMTDEEVLPILLQHGFVQQLAVKGRATDDNGDCWIKGGEAYYAPNAFRLRDAMRQTTFDYIVAVRMLRALGLQKIPAPPADPRKATKAQLMPNLLAGDFDMDGVLDAGGPNVPYFMMGISLGGIHTALTSPLEPYIVAAAPVVPGAGLADIFMRTSLQQYVTGLMHSISGPQVSACPVKDAEGKPTGKVRLSWNDDSDGCSKATRKSYRDPATGQCLAQAMQVPTWFAEIAVPPGADVELENLDNGNRAVGKAAGDSSFALAVASDQHDRLRVRVRDGAGKLLAEAGAKTPYEGLATQRNTPDFRKFVQLAANVLEGADAITVADRAILDPLPGYGATNVLMMLSVIDQTVPFTTGVTLARGMGLFGRGDIYGPNAPYRAWFDKAIPLGLLQGKDAPPPPLSPNAAKPLQKLCNLVETVPGQPARSGLCLADVHGHHEYIAQPKNSDSFPPVPDKTADGKAYKGTFTEFHRNLIVSYFHSLGKRVIDDECWGDVKCVKEKGLDSVWDKPVGAD